MAGNAMKMLIVTMMKLVGIISFLLLAFNIYASANGREIDARLVPIKYGYDDKSGIIYKVEIVEEECDQNYCNLFVFQSTGSGRLILLSRLADLSEYAKGQLGNTKKLGEIELGNRIIKAISPLLKDNLIVVAGEDHLQQVLKMLHDNIPSKPYNSIEKIIKPSIYESDGVVWTTIHTVITMNGALESITLKGDVYPFSIQKRESEVLLGNGSVPEFDYATGMEFFTEEN